MRFCLLISLLDWKHHCAYFYTKGKRMSSPKLPGPISTEDKRHLLLWSLLPQLLTSRQIHSWTLNEGRWSPTCTPTNREERKPTLTKQDPTTFQLPKLFDMWGQEGILSFRTCLQVLQSYSHQKAESNSPSHKENEAEMTLSNFRSQAVEADKTSSWCSPRSGNFEAWITR